MSALFITIAAAAIVMLGMSAALIPARAYRLLSKKETVVEALPPVELTGEQKHILAHRAAMELKIEAAMRKARISYMLYQDDCYEVARLRILLENRAIKDESEKQ